MDTLVVMDLEGGELPDQIKDFVRDLNWLRDEGYVDFVEDEDGNVRILPK